MDQINPMDAAPRRQCAATSKRSGERCKRAPAIGRAVCAMHGGKSPIGPASPHFADGRYSRFLPARMLARYHEAAADAEVLALKAEVALIDARIADVLKRVDTGESSRVWSALRDAVAALEAAQLLGDETGTRFAIAGIRNLVNAGSADWAAWGDVRALIRERKSLVESERKRLVEAQHVIAIDQAVATMDLLVDAVRRHVTDPMVLRAVTAEFARLTNVEAVGPPADC